MKLKIFLVFCSVILLTSFSIEKCETGVVRYFNEEKGFGYIIDSKIKDDLFVYDCSLIDEVSKGNKVKYFIRNTRKGYEAYDVRLK